MPANSAILRKKNQSQPRPNFWARQRLQSCERTPHPRRTHSAVWMCWCWRYPVSGNQAWPLSPQSTGLRTVAGPVPEIRKTDTRGWGVWTTLAEPYQR